MRLLIAILFLGFVALPAEGQLVYHFQADCLRLLAKLCGTRQTTTRENILLDKVGRTHIACKQCIIDHDGLYAGVAASFE